MRLPSLPRPSPPNTRSRRLPGAYQPYQPYQPYTRRHHTAAMAAKERRAHHARNSNGNGNNVVTFAPACSSSYSYSSSLSSTSHYPSSCSSISPPRYSYQHPSPPPRRLHASEHDSAREHLASLIRKHGPPTPVSSTSSLRKLTSTSPINTSFLPPDSVETPPASPAPIEETYESTAGSQPIPIPRANLNRSFDDLPITPLTGRFEYGLYLTEHPSKDSQSSLNHHNTRNDHKTSRKKKSRPAASSVSTTGSARSNRPARRMPNSSGPSLAMSAQSGPVSPKPTPKDSPVYLGNLPRFHPAVYQSPNTTPNASLSNSTSTHHPRSFGYRVASGGSSREALRQYRELVAASVSTSRNAWDSDTEISAPRLDPLGSPGPVTPLALEEADSYMATRPNAPDERTPDRQTDSIGERERHASPRSKDNKGR